MTDEQHPHIEGIFHLHEHAGKPVDSASQLLHRVNGKQLRPARHAYPDTVRLMPGQWTRAQLTFDQPDTVAQSFWVERDLDVYRDTHKIGTLLVTAVLSPTLAGSAETLERAALASRPPSRISDILLLAVVYLFVAVPAVYLAIGAYTPCVTNFEGGCGMARGIAALLSLLPATGAVILGIVLMKRLAAQPAIVKRMPAVSLAGSLLWLAPLGYLLFTLYALF